MLLHLQMISSCSAMLMDPVFWDTLHLLLWKLQAELKYACHWQVSFKYAFQCLVNRLKWESRKLQSTMAFRVWRRSILTRVLITVMPLLRHLACNCPTTWSNSDIHTVWGFQTSLDWLHLALRQTIFYYGEKKARARLKSKDIFIIILVKHIFIVIICYRQKYPKWLFIFLAVPAARIQP